MILLASDLSILPGLLNKTYEKQELAYVQKTLQPGQIFYDIGANFGLYSVLASQTVGANGCVYAFEPAPETYKNLQKNTQSLKNIKAFPYAVGAENGTLQLHFDSNKPGCSSALTSLGQAATAVPVIKIDTFLQEGKIQPADFIKIDVEGYEYEVLQGLMSSVKPNTVILCEFNPSFLRHVGRNPQDFLDFVHSNFKSVHFIHELNGQLLPITKEQDLRGQIVSNLVLKEPSAAGR